jgi:hypothetical protein
MELNAQNFNDARKKAGHNLPIASTIIKTSVSTLMEFGHGKMPKSKIIQQSINKYINKYLKEKI